MARRRRDEDDADEVMDELEQAEEAIRQRRKDKGKGKAKETKGATERERRRRETESEGEEHAEETPGKKKGKTKVSDSTINELARGLVRYAICNEASKRPLRRDDINKRVLAGSARLFPHVLAKANVSLKSAFGMEIVELFPRPIESLAKASKGGNKDAQEVASDDDNDQQRTKQTADARKPGTARLFALRTTLSLDVIKAVNTVAEESAADETRMDEDVKGALGEATADELKEWKRSEHSIFDWKTGPEQRTLMGILHVILALILVNERVLTDEQLMGHLKRLKLGLESKLPLNPSALRPEKQTLNTFLATLIKQGYLEKTKLASAAAKKGAAAATQGTQATQRVRATQATQRGQQVEEEGIPTVGSADEEWRWGPRADREIGEEAIAAFILEFYNNHGNVGRQAAKSSSELRKDIIKGATGGEGKGDLLPARLATEEDDSD